MLDCAIVKLVKLATVILRILFLVWFQVRTVPKKKLHNIWKMEMNQQPLISDETQGLGTVKDICRGP